MPELPHATDLGGAVVRLPVTLDLDGNLKARGRANRAYAYPLLALAEQNRACVDENLCVTRALLKLEQLLEDCR
jgi:hypothetical protein